MELATGGVTNSTMLCLQYGSVVVWKSSNLQNSCELFTDLIRFHRCRVGCDVVVVDAMTHHNLARAKSFQWKILINFPNKHSMWEWDLFWKFIWISKPSLKTLHSSSASSRSVVDNFWNFQHNEQQCSYEICCVAFIRLIELNVVHCDLDECRVEVTARCTFSNWIIDDLRVILSKSKGSFPAGCQSS